MADGVDDAPAVAAATNETPNAAGLDGCDLIEEGDFVVLDVNGDKHSFVQIRAKGTVKVGKHIVGAAPIIGCPFESVFEVSADGSQLCRVERSALDDMESGMLDEERNNASIVANTDNQRLSATDIDAMLAAGKDGADIIEALTSNNISFQSKTEFSQEKYKKRKAKKYMATATVRRVTTRSVCEAYYNKDAFKINNLRHDSLATALSLADVAPHAKVLVVERCSGIVTAAVAERLAGHGMVCAATASHKPPPVDAARMFKFTAAERDSIRTASLEALVEAQLSSHNNDGATGAPEHAAHDSINAAQHDAQQQTAAHHAGDSNTAATSTAGCCDTAVVNAQHADDYKNEPETAGIVNTNQASQQDQQQQQQRPHGTDAAQRRGGGARGFTRCSDDEIAALAKDGFDSCILADPTVDCRSLLRAVLPLLAPSAAFVVYSPHLQALAEGSMWLQKSKAAIAVQLYESWWRPYQVLPSRTHPFMVSSGTAGYLLSGIRIDSPVPDSLDAASVPTQSKATKANNKGRNQSARGKKRGARDVNGALEGDGAAGGDCGDGEDGAAAMHESKRTKQS